MSGTWELRAGSEVEVSWFPEPGEAFCADMLDGQAGTRTVFRYEHAGQKAEAPALILSAWVDPCGGAATVRLRLESPGSDSA
jgi:hypothetical protein